MIPKEKAEQLVNKFYNTIYLDMDYNQAKYAAIIAVDEILDEFHMHDYSDYMEHRFQYFRQVKQEIEKL